MAQSITDLFGPSATLSGKVVTFNAADFATVGLNGSNPTPSQIFAALLKWFEANNPAALSDPTAGVSPSSYTQDKTYVTRGTTPQIAYPITILVYRNDPTATFDPDNLL